MDDDGLRVEVTHEIPAENCKRAEVRERGLVDDDASIHLEKGWNSVLRYIF